MRAPWRLVAFACLAALAVAGLAPAIANSARLNAGMIFLTGALMGEEEASRQIRAVRAEFWLREAVYRTPSTVAAWRGLGLALAAQGREGEAVEAWRKVPGMASELLRRGKQALVLEQYQQALQWYERAARVEPMRAEPWYGVGRAYQELEEWDNARQAYGHALDQADWSGMSKSSLCYRVAAMDYRLDGDQSLERAWQSLEEALHVGDFADPWERSDCHFLRGMILWRQGHPVEQYIAEYESAIRIQPAHASAHAQLGFAYYTRDGNLRAAEAQLREAISLSPKSGWHYVMLAEVYGREGLLAEAAEIYERALQFPEVQGEAQQRLQGLRHRPGNETLEGSQ